MEIKEGQLIEGVITRLMNEGVFVDIGAERAAVISRKDIDKLDNEKRAKIQEGETIQVYVYYFPQNGGNPLVSVTKALKHIDQEQTLSDDPDPWSEVENEYQVGDLVEGTVQNIKKYGAFVKLSSGVVGLVHISEMEPGFTDSAWQVIETGEQVTTRIINIDPERKRIELSLIDIPSQAHR